MGADNWTVCPRCLHEAQKHLDAERDRVSAMYGSVPVEEFDTARAAIPAEVNREALRTFREDYEFYGAETGTLSVRYTGRCSDCGLNAEHSEDVVFFTPEDAPPEP